MALPERKLERTFRDLIVESMQAWLREASRFKGTIEWEVYAFDAGDALDEDGELMTMIEAFASDTAYERLFVVHPDRRAIAAPALAAFVSRLNARLADIPSLADLRAFEAHPDRRVGAGGSVLTRVAPFPGFQVLSHSLRGLDQPRT